MITKNNSKMDAVYSDLSKPVVDRFPRIVIVIIIAEFCERFSYSAMKAFLTLYLRSKLGYSDDGATETYHIFTLLAYLFPIFGATLSDNYLGKYRTILYMMFVYAAGNVLVAVTAIPKLEFPARLCTLLGLFMITIGTGGIKPCVTSFGGDQFILPEQEKHLAIYFSVLYFVLCLGSLIAKTVSPILRSEFQCFGDKDCYSLAFAAPGAVVIVSIIIFVSARRKYIIKQPEGNVVFDFVKCVSLGIKNAIVHRDQTKFKSHWLDTAESDFGTEFIEDVKKTLKILTLFTVLPVFFALLDQMIHHLRSKNGTEKECTNSDACTPFPQCVSSIDVSSLDAALSPLLGISKGSRWTLQASKMDGRLGFMTVKPDQLQVLAPVFILIIIPTFQKFLYPFLERRKILINPLHKLTIGGILAGVAFIVSGTVEIYLKDTYPVLPKPGFSQLRIYNGNECAISIKNYEHNIEYTIPPLSVFSKKEIPVSGTDKIPVVIGGSCIEAVTSEFILEENKALSFYLVGNKVKGFIEHLEKSRSGFPIVRFLSSNQNSSVTLYNELRNEVEVSTTSGVSPTFEVFASNYTVWSDGNVLKTDVALSNGGVYSVLLGYNGYNSTASVIVLTEPNSVTMALLLPQFLIISIAEVLFAVTGIQIAFKESPESMKAVMAASWLLVDAGGNVIIIIVTRVLAGFSQEFQSFVYSAMMFCSILIFHIMSKGFYKEAETKRDDVKTRCRSNSEALYLQVKQAEECLEH